MFDLKYFDVTIITQYSGILTVRCRRSISNVCSHTIIRGSDGTNDRNTHIAMFQDNVRGFPITHWLVSIQSCQSYIYDHK